MLGKALGIELYPTCKALKKKFLLYKHGYPNYKEEKAHAYP